MTKLELMGADLILVPLGEIVRFVDFAIVENLENQLQNIFGEKKNTSLIKRFYHFNNIREKFYSEDLNWAIHQLGAKYLERISDGKKIIINTLCYQDSERLIKPLLSSGDYEFLEYLAKEIKDVERYKLIK
ncbi:MAG: hypothetical protein AABW50_03645 [Nanoarchaeota archaeon]